MYISVIGERGDLDGESARLPDAVLDRFRPFAQMQMAGVDFAPGVDDGDDGASGEILLPKADLLHAGAMAEVVHRVRPEPAKAAKIFGFARHFSTAITDSRIPRDLFEDIGGGAVARDLEISVARIVREHRPGELVRTCAGVRGYVSSASSLRTESGSPSKSHRPATFGRFERMLYIWPHFEH